ncbi:hypothetical protein DMB42_11750 [Nonomuraea sp. WAC 01424]|uniref:hypothetical protein n=1 Tax=Nonomuraea sp. WAC 01424 TaxID=2203200 RepID=UPI000F79F7DC|nr:hypothetical protein [Nonomuraea sp. WAC 01424]RSN12845.1 hypothetical protein DMB42_11750 [Nonomuraea sp. WAC 01424]
MNYLDDLAEQMILPACRLVAAVQDRKADQVRELLTPLGVDSLRALAVVLAELIPRDDPATALFTAWKVQDNELPLPKVTAEQAEENRRRLVAEVAEYEAGKRSAA